MINFFEFRKLINTGELQGLIIVEAPLDSFAGNFVKLCKLYDIPNVYFTNISNPFKFLYKLDNEKVYIPYLETNLIDSCNLNCKACTHYANFFGDDDFYKLEDFKRDVKQLSSRADILRFRLLGGEPLKLKNLDGYLKIARNYLPQTDLRIVTNGLLIPNMPKYIFDSLRENRIAVDISMYPPTLKIRDEIKNIFEKNNIRYAMNGEIQSFNVFMTLHGGHNPLKARAACCNDICRFLRNGKIYKCPVDALSYKLVEHFGIKDFPKATGVDIFSQNFSTLIEELESNIELCYWCSETARQIKWTPENNPKLTDWLANPEESATLQN